MRLWPGASSDDPDDTQLRFGQSLIATDQMGSVVRLHPRLSPFDIPPLVLAMTVSPEKRNCLASFPSSRRSPDWRCMIW